MDDVIKKVLGEQLFAILVLQYQLEETRGRLAAQNANKPHGKSEDA